MTLQVSMYGMHPWWDCDFSEHHPVLLEEFNVLILMWNWQEM